MPDYDASVICEFAESLYSQARGVVLSYTLAGILIGASVGAAIGSSFRQGGVFGIAGAVIVGAIAYQLGRQKAFALRLQAQVALCQVQIEANTRTGVSSQRTQ